MTEPGPISATQRSPFARNIPVYYLFQFTRGFHFWLPIWFLFLQAQHGLSFTEIGLMEALFGVATVLAEVPTGAVADRFGRRFALALGAVSFAGATVLFATLNFPVLIIGHVAMAVARTLFSGTDDALLYDSLRQLKRTDEYERHAGRANAAATASLLMATLLSGPLAALLGLQAAILLSAAGMGLSALIALFLREPPRREADFIADAEQPTPTHSDFAVLHEIRQGVRIVRRVRPVLWTILLGGIMIATLDLPDFFIQPFIRSHGVDPADALDRGLLYSSLMLPSFFGIMLGALVAGPLASRLGERRALPVGLLAGVVCFVPLVSFDHLSVIAALALLAAATATVQPLAGGYINRRIPSDQRATVLSIFSLLTAVMITILIPVSSVLVDEFNFRTGFGLSFALLVTVGGFCWWRWRRAQLDARSV